MDALAIFNALLTQAAPVTAIVGTRIYPLELPQGGLLPAIVIEAGDDVPLPTIDANAGYGLRRVDGTVHLIANTLASLSSLKAAVEAACNFQRGTVAGLNVVVVAQGTVGAPEVDSSLNVCYLAITFPLTYRR